MYPSRQNALRALRKFCREGEDFIRLEPGEAVTEAEVWLLRHFDKYPPKIRRQREMSTRTAGKSIGAATNSLGNVDAKGGHRNSEGNVHLPGEIEETVVEVLGAEVIRRKPIEFTNCEWYVYRILASEAHIRIWKLAIPSPRGNYKWEVTTKHKSFDGIEKTLKEVFQKIRLEVNLQTNSAFAKTYKRLNPDPRTTFQDMLQEMLQEMMPIELLKQALTKRETLFSKIKPGEWNSGHIAVPFEVKNDKSHKRQVPKRRRTRAPR